MTSQMVLANTHGIAIASDTATTDSRSGAVQFGENKIFDLGPNHRVVVAHSSVVWIDDLPQSEAIRQWSNTLGEPLVSLDDYAQSFTDWFRLGRWQVSANTSRANAIACIQDHFAFIKRRYSRLEEVVWTDENALPGLELDLAHGEFHRLVLEGVEYLDSLENYEGLNLRRGQQLVEELDIDVFRLAGSYFVAPLLESSEVRRLIGITAALAITKAQYVPTASADLCFAGYGSEDAFPRFVKLSNRGSIGQNPLHLIHDRAAVNPAERENAFARTLAQDSAIRGFAFGMDDEVPNLVWQSLSREFANESEHYGGMEKPQRLLEESWGKARIALRDVSAEYYFFPFLNHVIHQPLLRLAEMAETFVELQKIQSEMSAAPTSVGGLVEVVTIDPANGVVWRKRLPN